MRAHMRDGEKHSAVYCCRYNTLLLRILNVSNMSFNGVFAKIKFLQFFTVCIMTSTVNEK